MVDCAAALTRRLSRAEGQTIIEYSLLVALVAVVGVIFTTGLVPGIQGIWSAVATVFTTIVALL